MMPVRIFPLVVALVLSAAPLIAADADLILHNGKIITVDSTFSIVEAVAVKDGRVVAVGRSADVLAREKGAKTQVVDLKGQTVLPGLTDTHMHPLGAALSEHNTPFAVLRSFADIQNYIRQQAAKTPKGQWIQVPKTFPGRLAEMRMPDRRCSMRRTDHPVFYDASYASAVNSYVLKASGITKETPDPQGARIVKDAKGEPNGILVGRAHHPDQRPAAAAIVHRAGTARRARADAEAIFGVRVDARWAIEARAQKPLRLYSTLKKTGPLPVRVVMTARLRLEEIAKSTWTTGQGDDWLKWGSFKVGLDGGMNAGTAYMREPYGPSVPSCSASTIRTTAASSISRPTRLLTIMRAAYDKGWQLSAHSQGGGAVDALLATFEALNKEKPIAPTRSHWIHASFLSPDAIARAKKIGALVDVQPDWLHFDGVSLSKVMSAEAMRYFVPLKSLVNAGVIFAGGSDHMVGWDKNTAINAYNPFLRMWIAVTRKTTQGVGRSIRQSG